MDNVMVIIKDISSALGLILTATAVFALCSKNVKSMLASIFSKYSVKQDTEIAELKKAVLELKDTVEHLRDEAVCIKEDSEVSIEFTKQQCRNIIKEIFYKYCDTETLPLYEHKTLMAVENIYINKLHGNSYAQELLDIMSNWKIDYAKSRIEED